LKEKRKTFNSILKRIDYEKRLDFCSRDFGYRSSALLAQVNRYHSAHRYFGYRYSRFGCYSVLTKKTWKIPVLEIVMRVFYGIALISGVIIMNVQGVVAINVVHKVCAILFMALIVVLLTHKIATNKNG
jgi:hypothetical protein